MQDKPTYELDKMLESMKPNELESYLKDNSQYMVNGEKAFYYYYKDVIETKNIFLKDVYIRAGVSESYGDKIIRMEKHTKDRDLILRFCISGHFSVTETNRALKLYGMSPLYSKDPRDVCIMMALNNRKYDLFEIDEKLSALGLKILSKNE